MSKKRKDKLTDRDWERVLKLRCASKLGHAPAREDLRFLERALCEDPVRYRSLDKKVFDATKPFGAG